MRRCVLILAAAGLFAAPVLGGDAEIEQTILELMGQAEAPPRDAAALEAAYLQVIDHWQELMGAADVALRAGPQGNFERICFHAGRPGAEDERAALCLAMTQRLGPEVPRPTRIWLARQLERLSGAESVLALGSMLRDEDPEIRELARRALQVNPDSAATDTLLQELDENRERDDAAWTVALINALRARRDDRAAGAIQDSFAGQPPEVRLAAIVAFDTLVPNDELVGLLLESGWADAPDELRSETMGAWLRHAERALAMGNRTQASTAYRKIYFSDAPVHARIAALRGFLMVHGARTVGSLISAITNEDEDLELRCHAGELLAALPEPDAQDALAAVLPQAPPTVQIHMLRTLDPARMDPERTRITRAEVEQIVRNSTEEDVRIAALRAIGRFRQLDLIPPLVQHAATTTGAEQQAARDVLALFTAADTDAALIAGLEEPLEPSHRMEIIRALAARWCHEAVPALLDVTHHADAQVRVAAYEALGVLARPGDAAPLVQRMLATRDEAVQNAAVDAVVATCQRIEDPAARAAPPLEAWESADAAGRVLLVRVLGRLPGPESLARIAAARTADDPDLVDAAVRALAGWPTTDALPELIEIIGTSTQPTHQVLAMRGYVRLLELPSERDAQATVELYRSGFRAARRAEEKRLLLGSLGGVADRGALALALRELNDEALHAEAEAAVIRIALGLAPRERQYAREILEQISADTTDEGNRTAATDALAKVHAMTGNIMTWVYAGPYAVDGRDWVWIHATGFHPEDPTRSDVAWKPLEPTSITEPWAFDLTRLDTASDRCVYVRCWVQSPSRQDARLEIGCDDAVKVWLDDTLVHEFSGKRGHKTFEDQVPVTLAAGWNRLMLKIVQSNGSWGFSCAVKTPDGQPLENLEFATEAPAP